MGSAILAAVINLLFIVVSILYWNHALEMNSRYFIQVSLLMYAPAVIASGLVVGYILQKAGER